MSILCYDLAIMVRQVSPTTIKFATQTKTTIYFINNLKKTKHYEKNETLTDCPVATGR